MPTPDQQSGSTFIEIADFSPGIHSDRSAAQTVRGTAATDLAGALPGNGAARVANTENCHADKTGALVPLPRARTTGMQDAIYPGLPLEQSRPYRYVLDAQVGNTLVDATETAAAPYPEATRQMVQVVWGLYVDSTP
jgi:hypothetical protein